MPLPLAQEPDDAVIVRVAWLYYLMGKTQEEVGLHLGLHRTRVVRLLAEARERGLVSVSIDDDAVRDLEIEQAITRRFGLDFCLATPPTGLVRGGVDIEAAQGMLARRAVGSAAARLLRGRLAQGQATVGVSWGRTLGQVAQHLTGARGSSARFVSLMGSLTRNSASNPFEVVQAFAARTGGEGYFLPVPFIADSAADRGVLLSQRSVARALDLARHADFYLISVGELTETAILRQQEMISAGELGELRAAGAVCDSLGKFFDAKGRSVDHQVAGRAVAVEFDHLVGREVVLVAAGTVKADAIAAVLHTGVARALVVDGDTARLLAGFTPP